jgi:hypothetical protein
MNLKIQMEQYNRYKSWVNSLSGESIQVEKRNLQFMLSDPYFLKKINGLDNKETLQIVSSKLLIVDEILSERNEQERNSSV